MQRQYSGTAGKIEKCQLAVHLVYATERVHAMLDAALYLPQSWCDDPERRAEAGVPEQGRFATKPQLAIRMIEAAVTAGSRAGGWPATRPTAVTRAWPASSAH